MNEMNKTAFSGGNAALIAFGILLLFVLQRHFRRRHQRREEDLLDAVAKLQELEKSVHKCHGQSCEELASEVNSLREIQSEVRTQLSVPKSMVAKLTHKETANSNGRDKEK